MLANGDKSAILGKEGYSDPRVSTILLANITEVLSGSDGEEITFLQFSSGLEVQRVIYSSGGEISQFELDENEKIIGVFGETYDNFCHYLKRLGFIIGKTI